MRFSEIVVAVVALVSLGAAVFLYFKNKKLLREEVKKTFETNRHMYELAILKELGERAGYSLNMENIADTITGSIHQLIEYSTVSYMILEPERIIFKIHLERSVHRLFVEDVKDRMLKSMSALLERELDKNGIEEVMSGAVLIEDINEPIGSFFNIPLVMGDKVAGVLTVAHTQTGLYKEEEMTILYKITQQAARAVSRLREVVLTEQGKLNSMVQSMTEGVVMTDKDYRIVVINPIMEQIIGLPGKKDLTIFDFVDRLDGRFDIRGKLEESIKLDRILSSNDVLINDKYYQIFVVPVKSTYGVRQGEILGGVVIFHDITRDKELERLRKDFTSMMVHELRSPLGGIRKVAEMIIKRGAELGSEKLQKEYVPMIYQSSSQMITLVDDLLDSAKIEAGQFSILKALTAINPLINDRISFFSSSISDAKLKIISNSDPKLPANIQMDANRIAQVLNNLISNAIKFTPAGGTIEVGALMHKKGASLIDEAKKIMAGFRISTEDIKKFDTFQDSIVIAVQDSGFGISSEGIKQLFNKFKQFQTNMTSEKKGTGLGLFIAKSIVEAHGGIIGVSSQEGVGSIFYFALPL